MKALSLAPNILVEDLSETLSFYIDTLGFSYVMGMAEEEGGLHLEYTPGTDLSFAIVASGTVQLFFQKLEHFRRDIYGEAALIPNSTPVTLYIEIDEVDGYFDTVSKKAEVVAGLRNTFYGMREFYIRDCNGNIIGFAQKLGLE